MSDLCTKCEMSLRCAMGRPPDEAKLCRTCKGIWLDDESITVRCTEFLELLRKVDKARALHFFGLAVSGTIDACGVCWGIEGARMVEGYTDNYACEQRYNGVQPLPKPRVLK